MRRNRNEGGETGESTSLDARESDLVWAARCTVSQGRLLCVGAQLGGILAAPACVMSVIRTVATRRTSGGKRNDVRSSMAVAVGRA